MLKIKISSKRQATFPKQVCQSLGIQPGDTLMLDRKVEGDGEVWLLRTTKQLERPWLGSLQAYASGKPHDMESVRASIASARTNHLE
jgi:AbrB family looped-hinge helix DNA binding protein